MQELRRCRPPDLGSGYQIIFLNVGMNSIALDQGCGENMDIVTAIDHSRDLPQDKGLGDQRKSLDEVGDSHALSPATGWPSSQNLILICQASV